MGVKFNVKYKIKINGKEYSSPEEMPDNIRQAYEKAIAKSPGMEHGSIPSGTSGKIIFNGQEYENVDAMPADVRQMYETVMKSVSDGKISLTGNVDFKLGKQTPVTGMSNTPDSFSTSKPIAPQSFLSPRVLTIIVAILALLAGLYFLMITGSR